MNSKPMMMSIGRLHPILHSNLDTYLEVDLVSALDAVFDPKGR